MIELIQNHSGLIQLLVIFSAVTFVGTLIAVPYLVIRIPDDYFCHQNRELTAFSEHHRYIRILLLILKNSIGFIVVLLGIILLVLPGQGMLTIIAGLILVDFPGKYRLERWLASRKQVLQTINWLRRRANKPPLEIKPVSHR